MGQQLRSIGLESAAIGQHVSPGWASVSGEEEAFEPFVPEALDHHDNKCNPYGYRLAIRSQQIDNPTQGLTKVLPKHRDAPRHHAALPYHAVPAFLRTLQAADASEASRLAFEFLILTGDPDECSAPGDVV